VDVDVTERQVWAVPPHMLLHQTVTEIQEVSHPTLIPTKCCCIKAPQRSNISPQRAKVRGTRKGRPPKKLSTVTAGRK